MAGAYDGSFVPGRPLAVRVQVVADRLVQGRLEVAVGDETPVGIAVEVPGGSTKEFLVVVPGPQSFQFDGAVPVQARLRKGSTDIAAGSGRLLSSAGQELVGLLPGALAGRGVPGPAPLTVDAGTARFAAIGPAELAQAPSSLGPVSTIVAGADELARLPAAPAPRCWPGWSRAATSWSTAIPGVRSRACPRHGSRDRTGGARRGGARSA